MATADVLRAHDGTRPLLLLDEPYAELDTDRRQRLTAALLDEPQVLVTAAEPPQHVVDGGHATLLAVVSGVIEPWTMTR